MIEKHVILFRDDEAVHDEFLECKKITEDSIGVDVIESRMLIPHDSRIVCRYSCLPHYEELENDAAHVGAKLINSHRQHRYIADMSYVDDIADMTPKTYTEWWQLPEGKYVVKGRTNSRKHQWNRLMFANSQSDISRIAKALLDDPLIAQQGLVVREYVPLMKLDEGLNGLPITNEWRFFCIDGEVLCGGFYWASHPDAVSDPLSPPRDAFKLAYKCAQRVDYHVRFVVIDVAQTAGGDWIVIELNDAQMSGLSMIKPEMLYRPLIKHFGC